MPTPTSSGPKSSQSVLTPQATDFPRWYQEVVARAELADNGPVRGTMIIRPRGYALWERIQTELNTRIVAAGAQNAYFPLFIPESYLKKEADHVAGFSPELAVVTHGGGKKLDEPIVVRPTSETVINASFAKWIHSHRDLPLLINQWANVVRWEMRPRLFLRTSEFLWQEGHTAHASKADAHDYAIKILQSVYVDVMEELLAVPLVVGSKTARERFAGATMTWTCEGMMRDGKALQMGTSHELGQNFAKAFDITYSDRDGQQQHVWQTSWGVSTRLIGAVIMAHGDDKGLRMPPRIAPDQVVVIVVRDDAHSREAAAAITKELVDLGVRARLDDRVDISFGRRSVEWELAGVPLRIEIGPKELEAGSLTLVDRHRGIKTPTPLEGLAARIPQALEASHAFLANDARTFRDVHLHDVSTVEEAIAAAATGFARLEASQLNDAHEDALNTASVSVRCIEEDGSAIVARAY